MCIRFVLAVKLREAVRIGIMYIVANIVLLPAAFAQKENLRFINYSTKHGLSNNTTSSITQDSKGFLWIATQDGLNKFNGYNFQIFLPKKNDKNSLQSRDILGLYTDKEDRIWIRLRNGGINIFDTKSNKFTFLAHSPNDPHSLSNNQVSSIYSTTDGTIWLLTTNGLNKASEDFTIKRYLHSNQTGNVNTSNDITCLAEEKSGRLWIGTLDKLNVLDLKSDKLHHITRTYQTGSINSDSILGLFIDKDNFLWVGTQSGLNRSSLPLDKVNEPSKMTFLAFTLPGTSSKGTIVRTIIQSTSGDIWAASNKGIYRLP